MQDTKKVDNTRVIQIFLWCVAGLFLCAFTSLHAQIPGLYGKNGLTPAAYVLEDRSVCQDNHKKCKQWSHQDQCKENAEWMLENCAKSCNSCKVGLSSLFMAYPTLLWFSPHLGLTTETGMELICFLGVILSFYMLLSKSGRDCLNFGLLWIFYFSLVQVGQIFLYYQWDNLLLEMAFFAALLAPWNFYLGPWNLLKCRRVPIIILRPHDLINSWLVKWLLFRLMFASGIVKLLWMDETWWNLTALNWHYESQCIPTPLAWYMQKMPVSFHRLSVVFTYLIEIAVPFLFFVPYRSLRIFAFLAQMLLQSMILVTGNYNFFNLSTMALCLFLVDEKFLRFQDSSRQCLQFFRIHLKRRKTDERKDLIKDHEVKQMTEDSTPSENSHVPGTWAVCIGKLLEWTEVRFASKRFLQIRTALEGSVLRVLRKIFTAVVFLGSIVVLIGIAIWLFGVRFDRKEFIHSDINFTPAWFHRALPNVVAVAMILGLVSLLAEIMTSGARCWVNSYNWQTKLVSFLQVVLFGFVAIWIFGISLVPFTDLDFKARSNVPAVFVRNHKHLEGFRTMNAYGLFRSMTGIGGRPEVVIMGSNAMDINSSWKEYDFIYKPGNPVSPPTFNVPHQPRLDWQMWFAALGEYRSNPWFIHLIYKLLIGEKSVLDLMARNPFNERPPKYIRSVLFRYHFSMNSTGIFKAAFDSRHERRWWMREYVSEYMPIVSVNDTALLQMVKRYGLIRSNRTRKIAPVGPLHHFIKSARRISNFARTEFLIYAKFGVLVIILLFKQWWNTQAIPKSQNMRDRLENHLKNFLKGADIRMRNQKEESQDTHKNSGDKRN